jgi:RimJ/RimL family protein N-acetyltransferase
MLSVPLAEKDLSFASGHVCIRPFLPADAGPLYEATRDSLEELCSWMVWCHPNYSLADSAAFVSKSARQLAVGERFSFAIIHRASGDFLGSVGLSAIDSTHCFANLGYWVRSNWTNRGIGFHAASLAARFAFEDLRLQRLELIIPLGNVASECVARKLGARFEGILRKRILLRGTPRDALMMSLLPEDLNNEPAQLQESAPLSFYRNTPTAGSPQPLAIESPRP